MSKKMIIGKARHASSAAKASKAKKAARREASAATKYYLGK